MAARLLMGLLGILVLSVCAGIDSSALDTTTSSNSSTNVVAGDKSCAAQSGTLHLDAHVVRTSGISPFLVFFDATATTDSAAVASVIQDVTFTWNFGDSGPSGNGSWAYGSNPAHNSKNAGSGIVIAHLYRTTGVDTSYTATATATDGANTASCNIRLTAYDAGGPHGFPSGATTCISSSIKPVAGREGCPAGAKILKTSSIQQALYTAYGNGKRLLFKCGDTFSGDAGSDNLTAVNWAIGAYGGCEDSQASRPIMSNNGPNYIFEFSDSNGDGTISDLDCEGNGSPNGGCIWGNDNKGVMYQVTIYNLYSNNEKESFAWDQCSQCGLVQVYQNNIAGPDTEIGTYLNIGAFSHYPLVGSKFNDIAYQAIVGSHFDGGAANFARTAETVRVYGCQNCYIANSDFLNAGPAYAQLKMHAGGANSRWSGQYTQYVEISDNYFGGTSGANSVEVSPENSRSDERLRYIIIERNVFDGVAKSGRQLQISGVNITARNNAFLLQSETAFGMQICQRGIEPPPWNVEAYNNSFYAPPGSFSNAAVMVSNTGCGSGRDDASNGSFKNNLGYFPGNKGGTIPMIVNGSGAGNTISNNTASTLANPVWTNASGTMRRISDWKPTANYSGGAKVPVTQDALGAPWSTIWDLGAAHH